MRGTCLGWAALAGGGGRRIGPNLSFMGSELSRSSILGLELVSAAVTRPSCL